MKEKDEKQAKKIVPLTRKKGDGTMDQNP